MVLDRHFSKYYLKYLFTFIVGALSLIAVDYVQLLIPEITGKILDGVNYGFKEELELAIDKTTLLEYVKELAIIAICVFLGRFLWRVCIFGNCVKIQTDIRNEMFEHMQNLSQTFFQDNKTGALMALYTNDLGTIRRAFGSGTLTLVDSIAMGTLTLIKMIRLLPSLTIICLVALIVVAAVASLFDRKISKRYKKNLEAYESLSDFTQEDFTGIHVVKAFVKERRKEYLFGKHTEVNNDTCIDYVKINVLSNCLIEAILDISLVLLIGIGGLLIYYNKTGQIDNSFLKDFTVGKLIEFNYYFDSLIWPIMAVGDLILLRGQARPCEKRVGALLDQEIEINDNLVTPDNKELKVEDISGEITFNDLTFKYPRGEYNTLNNISFKINSGEIWGIMGATGCGKSTIVELLLRLYNIEENKILLDNHDIMTIPIKVVRDAIAYVPQETFLYKQSIKENIAFSKKEIDINDIISKSILADINKDVEEFKDGYDTIIGERGVTVSGGQRQRISIARALMKESPILILDDSLSAVDTVTEKSILESLRQIRKGKTTIIIAHRITTLETLDNIIVMDDGRIDDIGNHNELLSRCKIYQKEVHLQELEKELGGNK